MRKFVLKNLPLSKKRLHTKNSLKKHHQKYDLAICGSDQIWRIDSIKGFDSAFFLDFINDAGCRKMSYAASFSDTDSLTHHQPLIHRLLKDFDKILVRDSNSLRLVEKECSLPAVKVVDPTFLINYDTLAVLPKLRQEYLLIYNQQGFTIIEEDFVKNTAKNNNLIIVSVGQVNKIAKINVVEADPKEWLGYFKLASYIVTNTYHGTIFSIIFKRQFIVILNGNKSNKTGDLLKDYNLEDRIFSTQLHTQNPEYKLRDIDYSEIEQKVQIAVANSKNCLFKAIAEKHKSFVE